MYKLLAIVALMGVVAYSEASRCDSLNVNNVGCFCGIDTSLCPKSECRLFCASRWTCSAGNVFCDYPMSCDTESEVCRCTASGMKLDGGTCCSGLAPDVDGKCGNPGVCVKDLQCLRFEGGDLHCDICVDGRCVENEEKNCGLGSLSAAKKSVFGA